MQKNTREDKPYLCDVAIESTRKLAMALEEIKNGAPEGAVCEKYNIKRRYLRHFIFNNHTIYCKNKPYIDNEENYNDEDTFFDEEILLSGGEKLYKKLEPNKKVPYDADEMAEFFIKNAGLKKNAIQVLRMRYWEDMTLGEVGEKLGVTRERIRQIEAKALRNIKVKYHNIIKFGYVGFIKQKNEKLEIYIKEKQEELEKYNRLVKEAKEIEQQISLLKEENKEQFTKENLNKETIYEFLNDCLENENISTRLYNCFNRQLTHCSSIWKKDTPIIEMQNYTKKEIIKQVRNLGWRSVNELEYLLNKRGIYFKEEC